MAYQQRGLEAHHEQNHHHIIRDTRSVTEKLSDILGKPSNVILVLLFLAGASFFVPIANDFCFLFGIGIFIYCITRKSKLPFRLPLSCGLKDFNNPHPGHGKPQLASGIYYFGNEKHSQNELWFNNEDMRTHVLIFGSTGSGKTEALVSLAYNALVQASGFIYVDGKGDNSLFAKVFSLVRSMGREDDLLLINFMTGARDIIGPQETRLSNTINPFSTGSSSMLSQLIISMMESSSSSSDGDMWKGRAMGFVEALMKVLVPMRDSGHILLDANSIRNYFHLPRLEAMVIDKLFIRDGQEPVNLGNFPPSILEPITNYLLTLPGYNKEKKGNQVSQVLEQHGFITMQLTRVFTSLSDTYGHILRTKLGEVDLRDVVLNRRILCVLLPALEKSPEELSNLGKVIVSSLRVMMASGLGDAVEGEYANLVTSKPTNSSSPYLCILDEYGYYAVEGFAVVPAQARSLGFSVVFAGQDLPAFQKASKEEAASIGANCNIKICMKLEDPTETWDFFMKSAGESYVSHVESFQVNQSSFANNYNDTRSAKLEKRSRVDLLDLKEQNPGEAHILFKSSIIRAKMFFANPKPVKRMRLNHFLKVDRPLDLEINQLKESLNKFSELLDQFTEQDLSPEVAPEQEIDRITDLLDKSDIIMPIDRAMYALDFFQNGDTEVNEELPLFFDEPLFDVNDGNLNIFLPLHINDYLNDILLIDNRETFSKPILPRSETRDQIEYLQRLCGQNSQQAMNVAIELVGDMERGTEYPPSNRGTLTSEELIQSTYSLIDNIRIKKQEAKEANE